MDYYGRRQGAHGIAGREHGPFLDPFGKIAKRIVNGSEDNPVYYFADFIPHVIKASR